MRFRSVFVSSFSACLAIASMAHADMRVAVVDVQRAIAMTEDGQRGAANLKKLFDNRQQELNRRQTDMAKQREEIDRQQRVLSREAFQKRVEEWQRQMVELQTTFVDYNRELDKKQKELMEPILGKMSGVIRRVATTEGYDIIVDRMAAPYARGDLELTEKCVQIYNAGGPIPAAPPPAAPGAPTLTAPNIAPPTGAPAP